MEVVKEEVVVEKKTVEFECYKCGELFHSNHALQMHLRSAKRGSCIGVWYVCKRCLCIFETLSNVKRHHSLKRGCAKATTSGNFSSVTNAPADSVQAVPAEIIVALRLKKGAKDAGGMETYLQHVVHRGNHSELHDVLEACSMEQLSLLLGQATALSDDTARFIDLLAVFADYGNLSDTSPEKRAVIKEYVDKNVTL